MFLQVLVRKWHSLKSVAQRIQLLDKLARLHECRIWALRRTCKNVECWMKSKPFVVVQRNCGRWLHVHCSTPCSSGSPLKHLNQKRDQTEADRDWHSIIGSAEAYLTLGDSRSFELPKHNQIWQRPETQRILERCGLNYDAEVALCQTGLVNDEGTPIGKRLKFFATSPCFANLLTRKFGTCACRYHAEFNTVNWHRTGYYSKTLAKAILAAARSSRREPC